jgi:hypothetical protein
MTVDENATCAQCIRVLDVVQDCCENGESVRSPQDPGVCVCVCVCVARSS